MSQYNTASSTGSKNCPICNGVMKNSIGGNYACEKCGYAENDLVYRKYLNTDTPSNPVMPGSLNYGWICPKCGRALSPFTHECPCYLVADKVLNKVTCKVQTLNEMNKNNRVFTSDVFDHDDNQIIFNESFSTTPTKNPFNLTDETIDMSCIEET